MTTTVRSDGILFNNGTLQTSAANVPALVGGTTVYTYPGVSNNTSSSSFVASSQLYSIGSSGTINVRTRYRYSFYPFEYGDLTTTAYYRIYINGVAVGSEFSTAGATYLYNSQTFTVAAGDRVQLYARSQFAGGYSVSGLMHIGLSSHAQRHLVEMSTLTF